MAASVSIYMVRANSMDNDPYRWSSLYTVIYIEQQIGAQYIWPVMGKSQIKSYMPNPKSSNIKSQIFTSNPNLKSLKIPKSQIF